MDKLNSKDFSEVFAKGKKFVGRYIVVYALKSEKQSLGVIASKKVGNSPQRHRAKRLIREAFRKNYTIVFNCKMIVIAKKLILNIKCPELEREVNYIFKSYDNV